MVKPVQLETERLLLRSWRKADRAPFAALNADPRVMEFFPTLLDRKQSDAWIKRIQSLIDERGWGLWAIELRHTGEFLGFVGLHIPIVELPVSPCVEIGWRLAHAHWGRGYATEAARAVLSFGFEELALEEIISFTTLGNRRSRAVMERLGMQEDPASTFGHPLVPEDSPLHTHCVYRLAKANWEGSAS